MPSSLRALSLAQPTTDSLHLGNYLGALRQWVRLQDDHEAFFGIADLHALTIEQDPVTLTQQTLVGAAQFLAAGVDPAKSTLFVQSHVPEHAQLAWILGCITGFGQANRMTQFKDKVARFGAESASVGLFTYPVLMAADILIYQAHHVPVGEDQRQHLELTRDLAVRLMAAGHTLILADASSSLTPAADATGTYDETLPQGDCDIEALSAAGVIKLLDDPKITARKIKSAVTDSGREIIFDEINKPGVSNLLTILSALTGEDIPSLVEQFGGHGYGDLKAAVADEGIAFVTPFRERTMQLLEERTELESILAAGAERARQVASRTLADAYRKVGLLPGRLPSSAGGRADSARVGTPGRTEADERYVRA